MLWQSPSGRAVNLQFEQMVSMAEQHVMVLHCQITPVDFPVPLK
ncbi:hypothetical protein AVDCRST_MAG94-3375 [uncultured Leptolyngbya sp.]|uniref:Glycoside hydrolase family 65 N-terminal domain-containing protein n=1 Tax=uncultured Leptolyngbya sp. TaxID=332963 RepID=A0A6J4MIU3_9CYAN|nr:hypothetical protein AVDCRST_MAG94-3375 [uncultured Leptolyngbya sp.]